MYPSTCASPPHVNIKLDTYVVDIVYRVGQTKLAFYDRLNVTQLLSDISISPAWLNYLKWAALPIAEMADSDSARETSLDQ
jgi:hypothetical protein